MRQIKSQDLYCQAERTPSAVFNPNGIASSSPGLRGTSYPGLDTEKSSTPTGLSQLAQAQAGETLSGFETGGAHSQGSSFLATLGFEPESLRDSPIVQLILVPLLVLDRSNVPQHQRKGVNWSRRRSLETISFRSLLRSGTSALRRSATGLGQRHLDFVPECESQIPGKKFHLTVLWMCS
jgi:hypothetical protein